MSENGAGNCIIDCEGDGRGVYFHSGETSNSVFYGITIRNGNEGGGAGIYCQEASPNIVNCAFINNSSSAYGGGIYCYISYSTITNCTFSNNTADMGGGICYYNSNLTNENCTISGNTANYGGGFCCMANSICTGRNNIIWENSAPVNSQIYIYAGSSFSCTYSDIQDGWAGTGNIDSDPLFQTTTGDSAYRLTANSPCIDAGDPSSPHDPDNTITDIGAFYFHHEAPITVSNDSLFFPPTEIAKSDSLPLMVYNTGTEDIILYSMSIGLPGIFSVNWYPMDYILEAGDSLEFEAFFAPLDTLEYNDTLRIYTSYATLSVYLRGEGVEGTFLDVSDKTTSLPTEYAFHNPYPNPFNPETTFMYDLPDAGHVSLVIYDVLGREVDRLIDGWQNPGYYQTTFNGANLSSGTFFAKLEARDYRQIKKILLIK